MLDVDQRAAILELHRRGCGYRKIARVLKVSRKSVKRVVAAGTGQVPRLERGELAGEHIDRIRELNRFCQGNLIRVWEELEAEGVKIAYSTLTAFCRRHGIGVKPRQPAGRYEFSPGQEMQHDTSPHDVLVGGRRRRLQCASLVMAFSTMRYMQLYPTFNRFYCKVFLSEAIEFFDGAAAECMVDNTSVIISHGTGKDAVVAPEMKAFGDRFGFTFIAHAKGHANRSARVERPFYHVETNFYPGRKFADLDDLNRQLIEWCKKINSKHKRTINASPIELFRAEKAHLKPLPIHVPEVYALHSRIVDLQGYVTVHTNGYSAPAEFISRRVQVRESKDRVRIFHGHQVVAEHRRLEEGSHKRSTLPEHTRRGLWRNSRNGQLPSLPEETVVKNVAAPLEGLLKELKKKNQRGYVAQVRNLYRMYLDYPTPILVECVSKALEYGLTDLKRIETMILKAVASHYFRMSDPGEEEDND